MVRGTSLFALPTEAEPVRVVHGGCRDALASLPVGCVDAVVTDPPYELGFMGKAWDRTGVAFDPATWAAVLRVLRPGGYMLAMGGTRTYHRLTCAVEDAGFEIRDCLMWLYGSGFPKHKACLKPAWEPILLARKPGRRSEPLNIDGCRAPTGGEDPAARYNGKPARGENVNAYGVASKRGELYQSSPAGRYPANVVHDGSEDVLEAFGERESRGGKTKRNRDVGFHGGSDGADTPNYGDDTGTAARFFYCAKTSRAERGDGNAHPTVKPLALMRWLVRLVCPTGGFVLDPFGGSGTTLIAAVAEGRLAVGVERDAGYCEIARERVAAANAGLFAPTA